MTRAEVIIAELTADPRLAWEVLKGLPLVAGPWEGSMDSRYRPGYTREYVTPRCRTRSERVTRDASLAAYGWLVVDPVTT